MNIEVVFLLGVWQQFEYIKMHTSLEVGQYFGAMGVDEWKSDRWEKETKEHDVSKLSFF